MKGWLCLERREGQRILVGEDIILDVVQITEKTVKLAIRAPRDVRVLREELLTHGDVLKSYNEGYGEG